MGGWFPERTALQSEPEPPPRRDRTLCVLVTTPSLTKAGGVAEYFRTLQKHMSDRVDYVTVGARSDFEHSGTVLFRMIRDYCRFAWALGSTTYDIVHLNPSIGSKAVVRDGVLFMIAKVLRKKVVIFAHGWHPRSESMLAARWALPLRIALRKADGFIVLAESYRATLRRLGYRGSVFLTGAPVDDMLFTASQQRTAAASTRQTSRLLFLGRVEKEKGIFEALETYRLVKQKHPGASLVVAGDGSALGAAQAHVADSGLADVTFTGHVEGGAKINVFRSAGVYLFPSYSEGLPLSVLEAMTFGLPVVTTSVGGLCDFFEDGRMGFSTASRQPEVLAGLVCRLLSDPGLCARTGAFNRAYARTHFRGPQVAAHIERIYRFVLAGDDGWHPVPDRPADV